MRVLELNHVGLHVTDVERSVAFYRDVMGFEALARPDFDFPGAWFALGSGQLHLIGKRASGDGRFKECHYSIMVDAIDDFVARFQELGLEHRGPKSRPDGVIQVFLLDPDGHEIELCAQP
ncbi:MAG: lactoylglutathione lyase [Planctomycetota bacterium]|jgi:lactoylglutathione lyase